MSVNTHNIIIVAGPPACGKSTVADALAEKLGNVSFLDKDDLTILLKSAFRYAGVEFNRDTDFYRENFRDAEYDELNHLACVAAKYNETVIVNAPYIYQVRLDGYMKAFREKANSYGARLVLIWVTTSPEACKKRMLERNAERDRWKFEHWDEYISSIDFSVPEVISGEDADAFVHFDNSVDCTPREKAEKLSKLIF